MNKNMFMSLYLASLSVVLFACKDDGRIHKVNTNTPSLKDNIVTTHLGYSELPNGQGGTSYESVAITPEMNFDKTLSLKAFKETLYPHLRSLGCDSCHSTETTNVIGAQSPLHSDINIELAHEYALTAVNFSNPVTSKFVERLSIDRHHCLNTCADDGEDMLSAVTEWKKKIQSTLSETPRAVDESVTISNADVDTWVKLDKQSLASDDARFMVYSSLHQLHNSGVSAGELNIVRVGLSKALNSVARWAPNIINPVDVNGKGVVYRFDIRDYWGWNKGVTKLLYGGSDADMAFGKDKKNYLGEALSTGTQNLTYNYSEKVKFDSGLAEIIWQRILHGNVEGDKHQGNLNPNIDGFYGDVIDNEAGDYIAANTLRWVEATQLIYTLTRPDVYNAIMMIPMHADQLEDELGVDKSRGIDSYDYSVTFDAMTVDSQFSWRANRINGGFYRKTFDVFSGILTMGDRSIFDVYEEGGRDIRFPFWANPIPIFIDPNLLDPQGERAPENWSFVATLAYPFEHTPPGCDPPLVFNSGSFKTCLHFTGSHGLQQSSSQIMWDLPNGLQGYMLSGEYNQRSVSEYIYIIRDPRRMKTADDRIATHTDSDFSSNPGQQAGPNSPRLLVGSSCIGCHSDGVKRSNNDLRDWLDNDQDKLPKGKYGADGWLANEDTVKRVRELYPSSLESRDVMEYERRNFLKAMVKIKQEMIIGVDKNMYVEPVIWSVEYAQQKMYGYPQTASN